MRRSAVASAADQTREPRGPRQRQVQVAARTGAGARLVGVTGKVGERLGRIAVQGCIQHVGPVKEDVLSAVAVMEIDIEDRNPRGALVAQVLGGDGGVVQKAVAAVQIPRCMMAGRAA